MGWGSAYSIFNLVADSLLSANAAPDVIYRTCYDLALQLLGEDWDTADVSLERYNTSDSPPYHAVVKALNDVIRRWDGD